MIIGVISDTHIPGKAKALPGVVLERLKYTDHIIHAGDISDLSLIRQLEKLAPVTAVAGNTDTAEARQALKDKEMLNFGTVTIGVFHGHGDKGTTLQRALHSFEGKAPHCIIFGHSHIPYCHYHNGMLLFNPGSPTDKRRNPYFSFGMLDIGEDITPQVVFFDAAGTVRQSWINKYEGRVTHRF